MKHLLRSSAMVSVCAAVAAFTGCQGAIHPEMTRCIDYTDHVVAPQMCSGKPQAVLVHGSLNPEPRYRPYYGGFGSFQQGSFAWGGSDRPMKNHLYTNSAGPQSPPPNLDSSEPYTIAPSR